MKRAMALGVLVCTALLFAINADAKKKGHHKKPPPPAAAPAAPLTGTPEVDAMLKFVRENFGQLKNLLNKAQEQVKAGKPVDELLGGGGGTGQSSAQSPTPAAPTEPAPAEPTAPTTTPATPAPTAPAASPAAPADNKKKLQQAKKAFARLAKTHLNDARPTLTKIKNDVMEGLGLQGKMKADKLLNMLMDDNLFSRLKAGFNALLDSVNRNFPALKAAFLKFLNEAKDLPELRELANVCNDLLAKAQKVIDECRKIVGIRKIGFGELKTLAKHGKDCGMAIFSAYPAITSCRTAFQKADKKVDEVEKEPDF